METRIFHGSLNPDEMARALVGEFNRGNLRAQRMGESSHVIVQIATREFTQSGGQTALAVDLRQVEDGIAVQIGKQAWLGVAASLGKTAFALLRSPWAILDRIDDLAQDIEYLKLTEQIYEVINRTAQLNGASFELSARLKRMVCNYCQVANPVGQPSCLACGAPLGSVQPRTCLNCGFVVRTSETTCPNCKHSL